MLPLHGPIHEMPMVQAEISQSVKVPEALPRIQRAAEVVPETDEAAVVVLVEGDDDDGDGSGGGATLKATDLPVLVLFSPLELILLLLLF